MRVLFFCLFLLFTAISHASNSACSAYYVKSLTPEQKAAREHAAISYQLLRAEKFIGQLAERGDRLIFRLSPNLASLPIDFLSAEGKKTLVQFTAPVDPAEVLKKIASELNIQTPNLNEILSAHGDGQIREMFDAKNKQDWQRMIEIYNEMPLAWKQVAEAKLQMGLALNRRNKGTDRSEAVALVEEVIAISSNRGLLGEAYGIRARIYKDQYQELKAKMPDSPLVEEFFLAAVNTYKKGFAANMMDYFPGAAGLNEMATRPDIFSAAEIKSFAFRVQLAVNKALSRYRDENQLPDFWLLATAVQLNVFKQDWQQVKALLPDLLASSSGKHNIESQINAYRPIRDAWDKLEGITEQDKKQMDDLIAAFVKANQSSGVALALTENSPSYVSSLSFPNMEGVFSTRSFILKEEVDGSGIASELAAASQKSKINIISFHRLLQNPKNIERAGSGAPVLLAPTGPYKSVINAISNQVKMTPWWKAYEELGLKLDASNSAHFIEKLLQSGRHITLLVPRDFKNVHLDSYTFEEFNILMSHLPKYGNQIHFVFGFESVYPLNWKERISETEVRDRYRDEVMEFFTKRFQDWLLRVGDNVKRYDLRN